jgi:hypothetical protein
MLGILISVFMELRAMSGTMARTFAGQPRLKLLLLLAALALAAGPPLTVPAALAQDGKPADADTARDKAAEKDAFQTAKDLGTADAWNAFLTSYPTGFHADMARAYLKKIEAGSAAPSGPAASPAPDAADAPPDAAQLVPSSARAGERDCAEQGDLRSPASSEASKITFVNSSGMYRGISWIDSTGKLQDYGGVNSGDQVTYDTFRMHAWMITTGPGDCLQIFLAAAEPSTVKLERLAADDGKPARTTRKPREEAKPVREKPAREKPVREKPVKEKPAKKKPLVCGQNYKLRNGECVLQQNCGQNARRSPEGDCYCDKGYFMKGGKCVWPQDKQGFEIAPEKKSGCKGWQRQCNQGNGKACMKYEETCQVN